MMRLSEVYPIHRKPWLSTWKNKDVYDKNSKNYQEMLKRYNVTDINQLSDEDRKKFFDELNKNDWKSQNAMKKMFSKRR